MKNFREGSAFSVVEIDYSHLEDVYRYSPFETKVRIAQRLDDSQRLQSLSKQALRKGDLREAYELWIKGKGNLDDEYINKIRTKLILESTEKDFCYLPLHESDKKGYIEAFDVLMQGGKLNDVEKAYEIAVSHLGDEERTQKAREFLVDIDPKYALYLFSRNDERKDEKGIDYLVEVIASKSSAEKSFLRRVVDKYSK